MLMHWYMHYAISILVISEWTMSVYEVILVHQYGDLLQSLSSLSSSNKAIHSFGFGAHSYVCPCQLSSIKIYLFCRPDHICCPLWCHQCCLRSPHHSGGFTVMWRYYDTYIIAILVMVSMIHSYINALIHFYDKLLSTFQNNAKQVLADLLGADAFTNAFGLLLLFQVATTSLTSPQAIRIIIVLIS